MAPKAHRNLPDIDWSSNPPSDADAPPSDGEALPSDVDAPPSGDETPPAGVAKPTALRPCSFKPQCSQQCPDLEINPSSPSFCQCGHLGSLHLPNNAQSRWLATIRAARSASHSRSASGSRLPPPLAQARAEVLSGFRDRAASTSSLRKSSGKAPAHEKAPSSEATVKGKGKSKSQGKGKGKGRELKEEVIRAIYLVPDAWLGHTMDINNAGEQVLRIRHLAPTPAAKAALEYRGLARISTADNPITLNPRLNKEETAAHLSRLFEYPHGLSLQLAGLPTGTSAKDDWFIQLHKERLHLTNVQGRSGATMAQLLDLASHEGRRVYTREIYLTVPFVIEGSGESMTIQADPSCGQKRKSRLEDSSEEDIPDIKRSRSVKTEVEERQESAASSSTTRVLRPRPRPRPRPRVPSSRIGQARRSIIIEDSDLDEDPVPVPSASTLSPPVNPEPATTNQPLTAFSPPPALSASVLVASPAPTIIDLEELGEATASFSLNEPMSPTLTGVAGPGPQSLLNQQQRVSHETGFTFQYTVDEDIDPFGSSYVL